MRAAIRVPPPGGVRKRGHRFVNYTVVIATPSADPEMCASVQAEKRAVARALKTAGAVAAFATIRRDRSQELDVYLFDCTASLDQLTAQFGPQATAAAMTETASDTALVRSAGEVVETLLTAFDGEDERYANMRLELLHNIFNGLGEGYLTEMLFYLESAVEASSRFDPAFAETLDAAIKPLLDGYFALGDE